MKPTNSQVHIDAALTNISLAFMQNTNNFVARRVFQNVPVAKQSDRYWTFDRGNFNRNGAEKRAPGAESSGSSFSIDNTPTYFCDVWAHHWDIPWQTMANADQQLNLESNGAEYVMRKLLMAMEVDWVDTYFKTGVWATDVDGASTAGAGQTVYWDDYTSGDPIKDIRNAKRAVLESTGFEPNVMTINQDVHDALVDHPDIIDRVKYSGGVGNDRPAQVTMRTIAQLLDLDEIVVAKAIQNTAAEGVTNSHSFIAGKHAMLTYRPPSPGLMTPAAGYSFSWQGYLGTTNAFGYVTKRINLDRNEATRIEGQAAWDHHIVSTELGYFFNGIVQ